jgi:hypothetical protein
MKIKQKDVIFVAAFIPAGYLPLMYILMVMHVFWAIIIKADINPAEGTIFWWLGWTAIFGTLIQWPLYIAWAAISRELTVWQRIAWIVLIFLLNMFTIPWFLWCKYKEKTKEGLIALVGRKWLFNYLSRQN